MYIITIIWQSNNDDTVLYSVTVFNLPFEYEYALTPRMREQVKWEGMVNVHGNI